MVVSNEFDFFNLTQSFYRFSNQKKDGKFLTILSFMILKSLNEFDWFSF